MIEGYGKRNSDREEDGEHRPVVEIQQQTREVSHEDKDLGRDDVRHNRAHEEPFFAFENNAAGSTAMFEIERPLHDRRFTTNRALQLQRTPKRAGD